MAKAALNGCCYTWTSKLTVYRFSDMNNSIIIAELEKRKNGAESESLASRLCLLADEVVKTASEHQKRVAQVMPEFDLHDEKHLAMVLANYSCLLQPLIFTIAVWHLQSGNCG